MGVEIEDKDEDGNPGRKRGHWCSTIMGVSLNSCMCVRSYFRGKEIIQKNQKSKNNLLRWDWILLKIPGDEVYNPMKPWVCKWDDLAKRIANNVATHKNDVHGVGQSEAKCRSV
eukprot:3133520-Ditylum_brightwellii.AAC.1